MMEFFETEEIHSLPAHRRLVLAYAIAAVLLGRMLPYLVSYVQRSGNLRRETRRELQKLAGIPFSLFSLPARSRLFFRILGVVKGASIEAQDFEFAANTRDWERSVRELSTGRPDGFLAFVKEGLQTLINAPDKFFDGDQEFQPFRSEMLQALRDPTTEEELSTLLFQAKTLSDERVNSNLTSVASTNLKDPRIVMQVIHSEEVDVELAVDAILNLYTVLDELYVELGGSGLIIDEWEVFTREGHAAGVY